MLKIHNSFFIRSIGFWFGVLLVCISGEVKAQQLSAIDSLEKILNSYRPDAVERVEVLIKMSSVFHYSDGAKARAYLQSALDISRKKKLDLKTGSLLAGIGELYYLNDAIDSAVFYLKEADVYFKKDTSSKGKLALIGNRIDLATVQMGQGHYQASLKTYIECIQTLQSSNIEGKTKKLITAYFNTGIVYNDLKDFPNALKYHRMAWALSQKQADADKAVLSSILLRIGDDFNNMNLSDSAYHYLKMSEEMAKLVNAEGILAEIYGALGKYFRQKKNTQKAIKYFTQSVNYAGRSKNNFQKANALSMLGQLYEAQGDYQQSYTHLSEALSIAREMKHKVIELKTLKAISSAAVSGHQYKKAVEFYQQYIALNDSLNISEITLKINEVESKYQNKQKADSILVLQKNAQLQLLALHKKQNQNIFTTIGASLMLLLGFLLYRNLRNKHRLLKKTEQLHEQQIIQLEKEHQLIAAQSLMKGQEAERGRLAKDLHDGLGGLLSGVKISLSNMKGNVFLSADNANAVTAIIGQLDDSINELRRVSHNMMPEALIKFGLIEALENYCESINQSGQLKVRLQTYGWAQRPEQDTEIILYRIVQELLHNVIKHAEAQQVLVQLMRESDRFTLTVEDDGRGFDIDASNHKDGAGLQNIRARADYLNGTVDIRTKPGEGTSVTIEGIVR